MARGEIVVGLDIGTTKICTLVAEVAPGAALPGAMEKPRVDVLGIGLAPSTGIRRGVVVDIEQTARAIQESVEKAQRMAGADVHSVVVGVTGEHIASLNSKGVIAITHSDRQVTHEDAARVVENSKVIVLPPDREIIHALPRGFALDGQSGIRSPVGMSGTRLEVETHIVTGATTFLRNVIACVERAGLHVDDLVLEPIATADATLMPAEKDLGVALLDIGGGTSDLAIFRNGDIAYSSVIPVGGNYVTWDIAAGLRVSMEEAERVKLAHAVARTRQVLPDAQFTFTCLGADEMETAPVRLLAEIVEPRITEAFQMLRRELTRSDYASVLPAGLVVSGGGALLSGLPEVARDITGLPTRVGYPSGVGGLANDVSAPSFATAVGLVQWGARRPFATTTQSGASGSLLHAISAWVRRILRDISGS